MKPAMPFEIDPNSDLPLWVQLRQRLTYLITSGHYRPGEQLPTVRGLAASLSINYNTVNKAYLSMISDGYIVSVRGRGVFVREHVETDGDSETGGFTGEAGERVLEAQNLLGDFVESCRALGLTTWEIREVLSRQLHVMTPADSAALGSTKARGGQDATGAQAHGAADAIDTIGVAATAAAAATDAADAADDEEADDVQEAV